ncbi:hypothetical protein [Microvirga sp. TS319]|uniref:hypothetical protein n=1 Tax=Microvirga sp. TS319 TaxID=3241165 RepID=UPI00351A698C
MKALLVSLFAASLSSSVMAQPAATTLSMTCNQARQLVAAQGAVVLHTGPTTYDRYVRDSSFCLRPFVLRPAWVRTADVAQCPIGGVCRSADTESGN